MIAVLPADAADPTRPSGGNVYDRRICAGLGAREVFVDGSWPHPGRAARTALAGTLAGAADGEVVLLDGLVACGVPEVVVPAAARLRLVVLVHLPLGDEEGADPALVGRERAVLAAAERSGAVVATSGWTARRVTEVHGTGRVHVVTPGADPARRARGAAEELLCVGSVTPTKGQDVLVEALRRVEGAWRCRIVGALDRAPEFVAGLPALDGVLIDGPLTGDALEAAFAGAGLLVLPSRTEAFGMVVLEALARGIPVLATDVGGVREALGTVELGTLASAGSVGASGEVGPVAGGVAGTAVPGVLVPPGDPAALATALQQWLDDAALRDHLRRAALIRRAAVPTWGDACAGLAGVLAGIGAEAGVRA